jgi:hypothetical protein
MSAPTKPQTSAELRENVATMRREATRPTTVAMADAIDNLLDVLGFERPAGEVRR